MEEFERKYRDDITLKEAIDLALDAVYEATEGRTTAKSIEIATITTKDRKFRLLPDEEVKKYVDELLERKKEEKEEKEE